MKCDDNETPAIYTGEDIEVAIDLVDVNFADLTEVIVGVVIDKVLKKTMKKTNAPGPTQVLAHPTIPTMCLVRLFRTETQTWAPGILSMEVTLRFVDSAFAAGKNSIFKDNIVLFQNAYTKSA